MNGLTDCRVDATEVSFGNSEVRRWVRIDLALTPETQTMRIRRGIAP
jgi:hypothetical protein